MIDHLDVRKACIIADIVLDVYIQDVIKLISNAVKEECNGRKGRVGHPEERWDEVRLWALENWVKHPKPLSYGAFESLLMSIASKWSNVFTRLPYANNEMLDHITLR
jgi:hypothetical protein